jgi:hypothetical protein
MARLPYGPVLILYDHITYVFYYPIRDKKIFFPGFSGSDISAFEFLYPHNQVLEFGIGNLNFAFNGIDLIQQLPYPHIHQVNDELLDNNYATE